MIHVAIVDDEPLAREVLHSYCRQFAYIQVMGSCKNAFELMALMNQVQIDVLLLDIDIPGISGINFIKSLKTPPKVIFTTAYPQYALESYELNAVDYLVKPISLERFAKAIEKLKVDTAAPTENANQSEEVLFVRSEGKWIKIDPTKIWFVEGVKDYIRIWMDQGRIVIHSTMKNFEEQLSVHPHFIRAHKSYIVNLHFIDEIETNSITIKDQKIAIGGTYREEVNRKLEKMKFG